MVGTGGDNLRPVGTPTDTQRLLIAPVQALQQRRFLRVPDSDRPITLSRDVLFRIGTPVVAPNTSYRIGILLGSNRARSAVELSEDSGLSPGRDHRTTRAPPIRLNGTQPTVILPDPLSRPGVKDDDSVCCRSDKLRSLRIPGNGGDAIGAEIERAKQRAFDRVPNDDLATIAARRQLLSIGSPVDAANG